MYQVKKQISNTLSFFPEHVPVAKDNARI